VRRNMPHTTPRSLQSTMKLCWLTYMPWIAAIAFIQVLIPIFRYLERCAIYFQLALF
jgi:hypothetical protein